jgi:minor curlin subunit
MIHRRVHKFSALFAASLAVPATAGSGSAPSCAGDGKMSQHQPGVTVVSSGAGHHRTIVQDDPDGTIRLEQHGAGHSALAVQSGDGSALAIDQSGASAEADVVQNGACNATSLSQAGASNRASVVQSGSGNRVTVRQGPAKEDSQ